MAKDATGNSWKVLMLEDNEDDALLIVNHLETQGCEISWDRVETEKDLRQRLAALEAEAAPASGDPLTAYQRRWLERPGTLERFLRADGGKVAKAGRRLRDTLKWREEA